MLGIQIITKRRLRKMLKEAHYNGLHIGYDLGYQMAIVEMHRKGTVIAGYDINQEVNKILKDKDDIH